MAFLYIEFNDISNRNKTRNTIEVTNMNIISFDDT